MILQKTALNMLWLMIIHLMVVFSWSLIENNLN